jgi:hypothetical protein
MALAVKAADDAGLADRDVEPVQLGVVHDDVGDARQWQLREHAAVAVEHDQLTAVGGALSGLQYDERLCLYPPQ